MGDNSIAWNKKVIMVQNKIIFVIFTNIFGDKRSVIYTKPCKGFKVQFLLYSWDTSILLKISDPKCIERNISSGKWIFFFFCHFFSSLRNKLDSPLCFLKRWCLHNNCSNVMDKSCCWTSAPSQMHYLIDVIKRIIFS